MKKIILSLLFILAVQLYGQSVVNPDKPIKGIFNLKMKKIWEITGPNEDCSFGGIQNIAVADDGRIYIMDYKLKKIFILDKNGKYISEFGKSGEGPGEFKSFRMGLQLQIFDNKLIFVDRGKCHYFTLNGKFIEDIKLPRLLRPKLFLSLYKVLSAPSVIRDNGQKVEHIKIVDLKTKNETLIAKFNPFKKSTLTKKSGKSITVVSIVIGGLTPMMLTAHKNNTILYGMSSEYKINKINLKTNKKTNFSIEGRKQKKLGKAFFN